MGWFEQAFTDLGNAFEDAAEDTVEWVEDAAEDTVEWVEDAAEDTEEWVEDAAEDTEEWVEDAAEDTEEWVEDAADDIGEAVADVADGTLNALDDYVFDTVDFITGGVIDIDYDDGQFSAGLDVGIASVGVSFGEQGFSAETGFDVGLASGEIAYDSAAGLAMSGSLGVDWGPLPFAEGHLTIGPEGDISIGGRLQATLPLPGGEIGGELSGGFERGTDGSWGAYADAGLHASGFFDGGAVDTSTTLDVDPDGDFTFESSLGANATGPLGAHAGFETSTAVELDDDVLTGEVIATNTDGESATLGGTVGATPGPDGTSLETDGSFDGQTGENDGLSTDVGGPTAVDSISQPLMSAETSTAAADTGMGVGVDAGFDPGIAPAFDMADAVAAEPPPSDFALQIESIESVETEADALWEDLGQ